VAVSKRQAQVQSSTDDVRKNFGLLHSIQENTNLSLQDISGRLMPAVKTAEDNGASLGEATGMAETLRDASGEGELRKKWREFMEEKAPFIGEKEFLGSLIPSDWIKSSQVRETERIERQAAGEGLLPGYQRKANQEKH
jgi:hypothetical protein